MPLLVLTFCAESQAQVGVASRDAVGAVVPTDTTRWRPVAAPAGRRVFVDAEALRRGGGVVEVWTWHAYASAHRPVFGVPYDRVLARDQVYCRVRATAPLQVVRYLGAASAGAFMFPPDVGPFGWAPGSVEEAVGTWACQEAGGAAGAR
ncbi:surface-adhesin E family protein [Rubrivirga sp.]|uniref:surface-adhesin E family protein n=1 Tax=Rubrivirga sp. TaxID=1885344 RepID=UPI003B51D09A